MERTRQIFSALLILLTLRYTISTYVGAAQQIDEPSKIGWLFSDASKIKRVERALINSGRGFEDDGSPKTISGSCRNKLNDLCGNIDNNNDELMLLECIQTFKVYIEGKGNKFLFRDLTVATNFTAY